MESQLETVFRKSEVRKSALEVKKLIEERLDIGKTEVVSRLRTE